jgi:hypothetical protein
MVEVEVEESLGLEETRKKEEEEGVVRIRGLGGARRRVGIGQRNCAVVISCLRTEGNSSRCIEKGRSGIAHLLYLRLRVTSLLGKRRLYGYKSEGVTPHVKEVRDGGFCSTSPILFLSSDRVTPLAWRRS